MEMGKEKDCPLYFPAGGEPDDVLKDSQLVLLGNCGYL